MMGSYLRKIKRKTSRQADKELNQKIGQIFLGHGQEELTDELILELVGRGFIEKDLRDMKAMGGRYSRPRNSIILPPEMD